MSERENADEQLDELLRAHGQHTERDEHGVRLTREGIRASADVHWKTGSDAPMAQVDVAFEPWPGTLILESFAGSGDTRQLAVEDALRCFAENTLHALLGAFIDPHDERCGRETWVVGGVAREVAHSHATFRGIRSPGVEHLEWVDTLVDVIESQPLDDELHWVRFFYAQVDRRTLAIEVLLDNEPWPAVAQAMDETALPRADGYVSVRFFAVLQTRLDVRRAAALIAARATSSDHELACELVARGVSRADAEHMVAFLPSAFGRALVRSKGGHVPDSGLAWRPDGAPIPFVLREVSTFGAAERYAEWALANGPRWLFSALAGRSAELNAALRLVDRGSLWSDLHLTEPVFVRFYDTGAMPPTAPESATTSPRRPWWKRW